MVDGGSHVAGEQQPYGADGYSQQEWVDYYEAMYGPGYTWDEYVSKAWQDYTAQGGET